MSKILSKEAILEALDHDTLTVSIPKWGGDLMLRSMTGAERDAFDVKIMIADEPEKLGEANLRAHMVASCAISEDGSKLFTEGDVEALGSKCTHSLNIAYKACMRVNKLTAEDAEALEKN